MTSEFLDFVEEYGPIVALEFVVRAWEGRELCFAHKAKLRAVEALLKALEILDTLGDECTCKKKKNPTSNKPPTL